MWKGLVEWYESKKEPSEEKGLKTLSRKTSEKGNSSICEIVMRRKGASGNENMNLLRWIILPKGKRESHLKESALGNELLTTDGVW